MIWNLGKKTLNGFKLVQSTTLFLFISKVCSNISKSFISIAFAWPFLLCLFRFFNVCYHFYFWNHVAFAMAMVQFILLILLITHFKNQLMGTKAYLSKVEAVKIKVGDEKFEKAKSFCKKYPSFFEILENCVVDSDGYVILQRDSTCFKTVLQYIKKDCNMKYRGVKLPNNVKDLKNLFHEAKFFGLEELAQKCNAKNCLKKLDNLKLQIGDKDFEVKNNADIRNHKQFYDLLNKCKIDDDGKFILQRDPTNFDIILEYMETGIFDQEIDAKSKKNIAHEAEYYGLTELANLCDIKKNLSNSEFVKVKIGSTIHELEVAVCQKYKTFFNQFIMCNVDDDGYLVIQRDGTHFDKIWKYMKSNIFKKTDDVEVLKNIQCEAQYYGITEIVKECKTRLRNLEANAAVFSRSIFSNVEKKVVVETGAAVIFLQLGFLGLDFTLSSEALIQIAKGLTDFIKIRNNPIYSDYCLIIDFTVPDPEEKLDHKIALDIHFDKKPVCNIEIFNNNNPRANKDSLRELIKDGCLYLAHKMRKSDNVAKEGTRQLTINY